MILKGRLGALAPLLVLACDPASPQEQQAEQPVSARSTRAAPSVNAAPVLLDATTLARYRAALPRVAFQRLQSVLDAPSTLWWDKETITPSYQDSVGDGSYTPIGARANSQGRAVIVPEGKRLFSDDGATWSFPFAHTAGMDRSEGILVVNFLSLPAANAAGDPWPVVYWTFDDNSALGGLGLHRWSWMFPKGTMIGEVVFLETSTGALLPTEIRFRERYLEGWATNAFRPFPTALHLSAAIKSARADWASSPTLSALVAHLESPATLTPASLSSPDFGDIFTISGHLDELPPIQDPALVEQLLTTTTFIAAYGEPWKEDNGRKTFYATTAEAVSVVPSHNDAGLLEVREATCHQCHTAAGRAIHEFEPAAILYGDIWGMDQIFSFHPWDETRYVTFNNENREVRPELDSGGIVVPYDAARHPASVYNELPPP